MLTQLMLMKLLFVVVVGLGEVHVDELDVFVLVLLRVDLYLWNSTEFVELVFLFGVFCEFRAWLRPL